MTKIEINNEAAHAASLAEAGGKTINDLIASLVMKAGEVAAGPVTVLNALRKQYGDKEDQILIDFPLLNSDPDDDEAPQTNGYTEWYKVQDTIDGKTTSKRHNFFTDYIVATEWGSAIDFQYRQCKLALGGTPEKSELLYQNMSRHDVENLKKKLGNELTKARKYLRQAIGCWQVMIALGEHMIPKTDNPLVSLSYSQAPTASTVPFNLVDNTRLNLYRPMTVGDVMKLDVAKAVAAGGHLYDALKAQLGRTTEAGKTGKYPLATSVDMFLDALMVIANFLDNESDAGQAHQLEIRKRMTQKKGGEQMVRGVCSVAGDLNALVDAPVKAKYRRLIDADLTGEETEAEAA